MIARVVSFAAIVVTLPAPDWGGALAQTPALDRARAVQNSLERQRVRDRNGRRVIEQRRMRDRALARDLALERRRMIQRTRKPRSSKPATRRSPR